MILYYITTKYKIICSDIILHHLQIQNNMQRYYTISPQNIIEYTMISHITSEHNRICSDIILCHYNIKKRSDIILYHL